MKLGTALIVLCLILPSLAAAPTTAPGTQPGEDLRRINMKLAQEVSRLKGENAALMKEVEALRAKIPAPKVATTRPAEGWRQLQIGMTLEQVEGVMDGWTKRLESKSASSESYLWVHEYSYRNGPATVTMCATMNMQFADGKLVAFTTPRYEET
jgi:hypothetical protein